MSWKNLEEKKVGALRELQALMIIPDQKIINRGSGSSFGFKLVEIW